MTPEKYLQSAGQLRHTLELLNAITAKLQSLPPAKDSASFSRRLALTKLIRTTNHLTKSMTADYLSTLAATTPAGTIIDAGQVELIREQSAEELAYRKLYGESVTNDAIIQANALEIEAMLPILTAMTDRCVSLLTAEYEPERGR